MTYKNYTHQEEQKNALHAESCSKTYLPLGLDLGCSKCLVVGGGRVALRKINTLINAGASVTMVSPEIIPGLESMINSGRIVWINSEYNKILLEDNDIVISATSDKKLNIQIGQDAKLGGKLSCVVSSAKDSNLIFPAIYSQDGITVAVHSNGKNCLKSKYTKNRIADFLNNRDEKKLLLIGIDYNDVSSSIAKALDVFTKKSNNNVHKHEIAFISTCQRWECYIYDSQPNQILYEIFNLIKNEIQADLTLLTDYIYQKSGLATFHHLVRLCTGLDSSLVGETEIVAQINSAMNNSLDYDAILRSIFELALVKSNKIRSCYKKPLQEVTWPATIISFLKKKNYKNTKTKITISGSTRFAEKIYTHLKKEYPDTYLEDNLSNSDILILCRELQPEEAQFINCCDKKTTVMDLTRHNHFIVKSASSNIKYFSLNDIADSDITVEIAVNKAQAEKKAIEQSLIWHSSISNIQIPSEPIKIGARSSGLSNSQVSEVLAMLTILAPDLQFSIEQFSSPGDRDKITPLPKITESDFFTKDLDTALMSYKIDLAIHSAKDLPEKLQQSLYIAAITPSIAAWDCLVSRNGLKLFDLPVGARIGTSSQRRAERILSLRPDLQILDIRGNICDRIGQLDSGKYDAIVLASVGLIRIGLSGRITEIFPESIFPVEQGQGSLALITRKSDSVLNEFLRPLNLAAWGNR